MTISCLECSVIPQPFFWPGIWQLHVFSIAIPLIKTTHSISVSISPAADPSAKKRCTLSFPSQRRLVSDKTSIFIPLILPTGVQETHLAGGSTAHESHVRAAGGKMITSHTPIGVAVAQSCDTDFPAKLLRLDPNLLSVGTKPLNLPPSADFSCTVSTVNSMIRDKLSI